MKHIWAPWRIEYIRAEKTAGCILCQKPAECDDERDYILYRGERNFVILNAYPYNPGHLMVAPYRHVSTPEELPGDEMNEHYQIVNRCIAVLRQVYHPQGFNIGMNIGSVAGAGVEGHIHTHIVPRWSGDTNFTTVVADNRVVPEALADTFRQLQGEF